MDINTKVLRDLEHAKRELTILYEISNAMRTTLKLDEILYIILTGVTAHIGMGFNRAILFLVNEKDNLIEGKMGIGPENGDEANRIWTQIDTEKKNLDDLISAFKSSQNGIGMGFNAQVRYLKIPLKEQSGGVLALCVLDGMPLHLNRDSIRAHPNDPIVNLLKSDEVALVPLKAKDKVNGIIFADNFVTKKPISKDDLHMLIMLANQAGLAIENSQLYEKTLIQAHLDSLTHLWNHGYFQFLLHEEFEKAKASKTSLSLIAIDIDDFKVYNDSLGHQAGDKILKELALLLKNQSRKMDFVCRYGGEEFMIILPQTDKDEAFLIAERLRQDIARYVFVHEEILPQKKLTVSVGIATFPENAATPSELIAYSDKTLYQAKRNGKNNTCSILPSL
jgi:diguanylate cyclase (GGDEF)-like protein